MVQLQEISTDMYAVPLTLSSTFTELEGVQTKHACRAVANARPEGQEKRQDKALIFSPQHTDGFFYPVRWLRRNQILKIVFTGLQFSHPI